MADNKEFISTNITKGPGLITDVNDSYLGKEFYSYARNMDRCTIDGDIGTIPNSASNTLCVDLTLPFLGSISLNDDRFVIFSGDGLNSEIGILNERTCEYVKSINAQCLSLSKCSPITGVAKKTDNNEIIITFRDDINSVRRINLNKIPYLFREGTDECKTKEFTKSLDCDAIQLFPSVTIPCIDLNDSPSGNLENGTYSALISYTVDGQIYTDYYGLTQRIQLYSKDNRNGIVASITNLDRDFDNYDFILIQDKRGAKTAFYIGNFSTAQTSVVVDDITTASTVNLEEVITQKRVWDNAGLISANSNYLILADLTRPKVLNYQPQAIKIETEYVVKQVSADYYENSPKDLGYYRDENYEFSIEWLNSRGAYSHRTHIAGPKKSTENGRLAGGADVYEKDARYSDQTLAPEVWEVENTAENPIYLNLPFTNGERFYAYGKTGYHQSSEKYDDNTDLFGEDACTYIRHHRMPNECKVPRYQKIEGKTYINILGVQFKNIEYPKDEKGNPIQGYVGYRITRSNRFGGNRTVIARGISTNIRHYNDKQNDKNIWYSNYPYNDLRPDSYLSSSQTVYKNGEETNFTPLTGVFDDKFAFYTPHANFSPTYKMGDEFKFESEESGRVKGYFEPVEGHPKNKLLTQFAFWLSLTIGTLEAILINNGKKCITSKKTLSTGTDSSTKSEYGDTVCISSVDDLAGLDPIQEIRKAITAGSTDVLSTIRLLRTIIRAMVAAGLKVAMFGFNALKYAEDIMNIIDGFTREIQYAYQYNSHVLFDTSRCIQRDYRRRFVLQPIQRITPNLHTVSDITVNNFAKAPFMFVELNEAVKRPSVEDTSRNTISGFGICDDITKSVEAVSSAFYCTSKIKNVNQYGRIGSTPQVLASSCVHSIVFNTEIVENIYESTPIFGGDCVITKFAIQTKQPLFRQNLASTIGNELTPNFPDNTTYDYRLYRNIGYARFWMDTDKYDFSNLVSSNVVNFAKFSRTTSALHNLDCKKSKDGKNAFRVDNAYMYTSVNGVMEFYVESDYNIAFREEGTKKHYSKEYTDLSSLFTAPKLWLDEEFVLNPAFTRLQASEFFSLQIPTNFKNVDNEQLRNRNDVIYSLPSFNTQSVDNWRYFLPNNHFTFSKSDYGNLVAVHKVDQDRLLYLFDRSSPYISIGRDELQTLDGRKVLVGDGGMFSRDPREIMPTDVNYGSCQSKYAFSGNQYGYFYPSEDHGRFFSFTNNLKDISKEGMYFWSKQYMPIMLYTYFPNYPREENPVCGVGYLSAFDSTKEIIYITKKDYVPKPEWEGQIIYNTSKKRFEINGTPIHLKSEYFEDASHTWSYSPSDEKYIGWHDWHPDWTIQTEKHFMTVKDTGIWKHNETTDSFCNYYGIDYPFSIELVDSDGQIISTRRSLEYQIEAWIYKNKGRDRFNLLNANFDTMIAHNNEQMSPLLTFVPNPQTRYGANDYPKKVTGGWEVLYSKEENKYRVNQFWDSVKDRGEFTGVKEHLWVTHPSGYKRKQNLFTLNLNKEEKQRKKFRHYFTKFLFTKNNSGNIQYLVKLFNIKKQASIR